MDYSSLLNILERASLFDLWRLHAAIARALEDPRKNEAIRDTLRIGQAVRYFDPKGNREIAGHVVEIKRSRALIRHDHDQKIWNIPFYMINLQNVGAETLHNRRHQKVHRDSIRVGDHVGYRSQAHREVYGVVLQRNRKTATVRLNTGDKWRVPYGLLFYVLDAQETTEGMSHPLITAEGPATEGRTSPEKAD